MKLADIQTARAAVPPRILIYGEHGIGKSTWAAGAPRPIFLQTEDGLTGIDAPRFPLATDFDQVESALTALCEPHDFGTVIIDSADWLEAIVQRAVAIKAGHKGIEDFGYGKGYSYACDKFREVLSMLNFLRTERGMGVILTAHARAKRFNDPLTEPYDRYEIKLHEKTANLLCEWCDVVGFASLRYTTKSADGGFGGKVTRAVETGERTLSVISSPAYEAKNRYGILNGTMPLTYAALEMAITANTQAKEF